MLVTPQVRQADIADPIDAGEGADLVILHQVLHYIEEPGTVLANAARALKPGGWVLVVDITPHSHDSLRTEHAHRRLGMSTEQMKAWGEAAGLGIIESREFANRESPDGLTVCLHLLARSDNIEKEAE